jgi:hypothetical protein
MIAKLKKNRNPRKALNYLLQTSKQARIIGGQVFGSQVDRLIGQPILDPQTSSKAVDELSNLFQSHSYLNGYATGSVRHISLGFDPDDGYVSDENKIILANRLMEDLGFEDTLWVVIDHHRDDPKHSQIHNHDHIHIISHSLNIEGSYVNDYFDYYRIEASLRQSELELGLTRFRDSDVEINLENPFISMYESYIPVSEGVREPELVSVVVCEPYVEVVELEIASTEHDTTFEIA